jgi:branched-chain amino acid aminotransferase
MYTAYLNGEWIPSDEVSIGWADRGFRFGDTVFDAARTYNGRIFKLDRHVDRLYRSLKYVRIDPGMSEEGFATVVEETVDRNRAQLERDGDFQIYMFVTRGPGRFAVDAGPPAVGVVAYQLPFWRMAPFLEAGAHGVIARSRSYSSEMLEGKLKHQSRLNMELAELEVADIDPEAFAILLDRDGNLTEGTFNSVFMVSAGVLRTPKDDSILQSISRETVLELAAQLGIPTSEEPLQPYDLYTADEAFFTFTGPGVLPMTKADHRQVGDGKPGPITRQLLAAWSEMVGLDVIDQANRYWKP